MWHLKSKDKSIGIDLLFHTLEDVSEYIRKQPIPLAFSIVFIPVFVQPKPRTREELEVKARPLSNTAASIETPFEFGESE